MCAVCLCEGTYASNPACKSCLSHLNKKCFSMMACTAETRPLVVFLGVLNPNAKLWPYGRKVNPVLVHSILGGIAQEPKTNALKACKLLMIHYTAYKNTILCKLIFIN